MFSDIELGKALSSAIVFSFLKENYVLYRLTLNKRQLFDFTNGRRVPGSLKKIFLKSLFWDPKRRLRKTKKVNYNEDKYFEEIEGLDAAWITTRQTCEVDKIGGHDVNKHGEITHLIVHWKGYADPTKEEYVEKDWENNSLWQAYFVIYQFTWF